METHPQCHVNNTGGRGAGIFPFLGLDDLLFLCISYALLFTFFLSFFYPSLKAFPLFLFLPSLPY
jgi:hypothetical protein